MWTRGLLYSLAGITAALFGWNIALLLVYLIKFILTTISQNEIPSSIETILFNFERIFLPEIFLFPIVASCLSVLLVLTAIYLSNPTHDKANKRRKPSYIKMAGIMGITTGLISAFITILLYQPTWTSGVIRRLFGWGIIGLGIGVAEGLCWYLLTTEGASSFTIDRLIKSPVFGCSAGFIAAFLIELIGKISQLGGYEEPLGFTILGICLGLSLTFSTTPAYQVALRAGRGFGMTKKQEQNKENKKSKPTIKLKDNTAPLSLIYFPDQDIIEEGLSIQLPNQNNSTIIIGSAEGSHIFLPRIPAKAATLTLEKKQWTIRCFAENKVQIQTKYLLENSRPQPLHHNQILTFYYEQEKDKFYRFIFYDRFLDPST